MIIVDTNVASELMADDPDPQVIAWLDGVDPEELWMTAVTVLEIKGGIDTKPKGRRKTALLAAFDQLLRDDFQNRVLSFDFVGGPACRPDRCRSPETWPPRGIRRYADCRHRGEPRRHRRHPQRSPFRRNCGPCGQPVGRPVVTEV